MLLLPFAIVQRPAPVGQPAHDHPVAADHLHAVDAQILARLVGTAGHHQAPGDQRSRILGPAGLYRQIPQIHLVPLLGLGLAGGVAQLLGGHVEHLAEHRQFLPGVLHPLGRIGLLEKGQQPAHLPQGLHALLAHAHGHPFGGAEQVAQQRITGTLDLLEQQGRSAGAQGAVADLGDLQIGIDLQLDAFQLTALFELFDEISQVFVLHMVGSESSRE